MFKSKDSSGFNRYIGASKAKVIDNRDPNNRGRIRVEHSLLGETTWIEYVNDFGNFNVPSIGELVYVQCDTGMYEFPFAWGRLPLGNFSSPNTPIPYKRDVPTNRGLFSPGGHYIELDDGEAKPSADPNEKDLSTKNKGIRITSSANNKIHIVEDSESGMQHILIQDASGNFIKLDYKDKSITITSTGNSNTNTAGNATTSVDGNLNITVKGNSTITADSNATFAGKAQTTVGDAAGPTMVEGQMVTIAGPGFPVARLGDRAIGIGNLGGPVLSTIIQGSSKVTSG